jgi:hypothetical protein
MYECSDYGCTKRVRIFPRLFGWKVIPQPIFGGMEKVLYCPKHIAKGRERSKVECHQCGKINYLSDRPAGWDYVYHPAGTFWFCPEHFKAGQEYIYANMRR